MGITQAADPYESAAEYFDVFSERRPLWNQVLCREFANLDPTSGPIIDIGSGSGRPLLAVQEVASDMDIWGLEPSSAMRAVLHARVLDRGNARNRVTVIPDRFEETELPQSCGGFLALGVLGHFDWSARARLWATLRERLVPGGPAVVDLPGDSVARSVPMTLFSIRTLGSQEYECWLEAEAIAEQTARWRILYRTVKASQVIHETVATIDQHLLSRDELIRETSEHQIVSIPLEVDNLWLLRTSVT